MRRLSGWSAVTRWGFRMRQGQPAEILRILISESDRFDGKPLYEAIVAKCRELKIAGSPCLAVWKVMEKRPKCTRRISWEATVRSSLQSWTLRRVSGD